MRFGLLSFFSQGWFALVTGFLLFNVLPAMLTVAEGLHAQSDTTPPTITNVQIPNPVIASRPEPQDVTMDVSFTDNLSGVHLIQVWFDHPSRDGVRLVTGGGVDPGSLVAGTNRNGTFRFALQFPAFAATGDWIFSRLSATDYAGNPLNILEAEIASRGFPTRITVTGGPSDTTPPTITNVQIPNPVIASRPQSQDVTMEVSFTDDLSGVHHIQVWFDHPSRDGVRFAIGSGVDPGSLVAGTNRNGTFRFAVQFPAFAATGDWIFSRLSATDYAGNPLNILEAEIASRGFPTRITVTSGPSNQPPTANAGSDQMVTSGQIVTLTGSGSDPEGQALTFMWTQVQGSTVSLSNSNSAIASFTGPQVTTSIVLRFRLTVSDGSLTAEAFVNITVNPALTPTPTVTSISPSTAVAGGPAFTLTVTGTNFTSSSVVQWNGTNRTTMFVDGTRLTAAIAAADTAQAGTATVRVNTGTVSSNSVNFTIASAPAPTPAPTIISLAPGSAAAGGQAFKLTVTGTNYNTSSVVRWNGSDRTTVLLNPMSTTTLEATITALDIATPGTAQVTVFNPGAGGGQTSNAAAFIITGAAPTVTGISPTTTVAGGPAFNLSVTGTNFTSSSVVQWNGTNRTTMFVDGTRLTAAIAATDISQAGTATVRVTTGTVNSNSVNFSITGFSSLYFPQVVTGGGYSTVLQFNNLGASAATGNLVLTDSFGNPFVVSLNETPVSLQPSEEPVNIDGSSFPISVPAGGTRVFLATSLPPNQVTSGWARFETTSGGLSGLSTFLLSEGLALRSVAGVLATQPVEFATIGVDNSLSQGRFTGFSIANPTDENINIRLVVLNADGNITATLTPPELNPLGPRRQVSKFLHEYLPSGATFRGSMVLAAQGGKKFAASALIQFQGLLTATPVTPDKPAAVIN